MGFPHFFHKNSRSNSSICWPITMRLRDGRMASWIFWTKAQHWRARWILEPSKRIPVFPSHGISRVDGFFQCVLLISPVICYGKWSIDDLAIAHMFFFFVATRNYQVNYKWNLETKLTVPVSRITGGHLYCIVIPQKIEKWIAIESIKIQCLVGCFNPSEKADVYYCWIFLGYKGIIQIMFGHGHFACCRSLSIIQSSSSQPATDMSLKFWDSL